MSRYHINKSVKILAGRTHSYKFHISSKDQVYLFDINVRQTPHRNDDIMIYILDEKNYEKYNHNLQQKNHGIYTSDPTWMTYSIAKIQNIPIYFQTNICGDYYLVLDNTHSSFTDKNIQITGNLAIDNRNKISKSIINTSEQIVVPEIHEKIINVSKELFSNGHYSQAIFDSLKLLEMELKNKSKSQKIGESLANDVLNHENPKIKITDCKTEPEIDEQRGFRYLFAGAFVGIKNPNSHSFIKITDEKIALEYLSFFSMLMRKLDKAKITRRKIN